MTDFKNDIMIICYEFNIYDLREGKLLCTLFAKNIDDLLTKIVVGKSVGIFAVCGWKIKK